MNVSLTPELEQLIHKKVETGLYLSASEVVREALRLLEERDKLQAMKFEEVRKEIQIGIDQADRGEVAPLDVQGHACEGSLTPKERQWGSVMARVTRSKQAQQDLEEILDYLDSQSSDAADRFAAKFDDACDLHATHPQIGASSKNMRRI